MIEIGIISIIVLAVGYWVTLWLMGRHDDVLHGDFVHEEAGAEGAGPADRPLSWQPPFPPKPPFPAKPVAPGPRAVAPRNFPAKLEKSSLEKSSPGGASLAKPVPVPPASALSERSDTLQTLLASIKRDLKDASQL